MSLSYVPVMAAKRGEFTALTNLPNAVANRIIPLFELPAKPPEAVLHEKRISKTAVAGGKAWSGRPAFLDISKWSPDARTESGIHVLEFAFAQLRAAGVSVHPVLGYDRWDDPVYSQALKNIRMLHQITPCIRLDLEAIQDDLGDLPYFQGRIQDMLADLSLGAGNCYVMVDFGDVSKATIPDIIQDTEAAVHALRSMGFSVVIVAGGSMPAGVNLAVDTPDTEGCIARVEMQAWKAVLTGLKDDQIVFGDYLIRSPEAVEGVIAPDANAKIRYTIENQFFIVRGHTKKRDSLEIQHKELARKLVASVHYMKAAFSWGDSELLNCSLGIKQLRDPTSMIAVDSSHHIHMVMAEVTEHVKKSVGTKITNPTDLA
ncbi:beta family protein [Burkholderia sp. F1]|uniref:beta family protein n=1 Tax=Burkholderia sp. F1 TaxID=3366817 RepID=UPI003D760FC9